MMYNVILHSQISGGVMHLNGVCMKCNFGRQLIPADVLEHAVEQHEQAVCLNRLGED